MTTSLTLDQVISQVEGFIVSDMDGEKVMLSIQNGKYYNLGQIGGEIWDLIKEPIAINEIVSALLSIYQVPEKACEEQVTSFLQQLLEEELIQIK